MSRKGKNRTTGILQLIFHFFFYFNGCRTDKVVTDLKVCDFEAKLKSVFPHYAEHLILSWYLSNAKTEGLSPKFLPEDTMWMIADFAQNIKVTKRWETAEEYFKRPEIALHGIVSGFLSSSDKKQHETSHVTTSDNR